MSEDMKPTTFADYEATQPDNQHEHAIQATISTESTQLTKADIISKADIEQAVAAVKANRDKTPAERYAEHKDTVVNAIIKNVTNYFDSQTERNPTVSPGLVKRTVATNALLIGNTFDNWTHMVGIQPMQGPVGLNFLMQCKYTDEPSPMQHNLGEIPLEGTSGKRVTVEVNSHAIEARSRKLQAAYSTELQQDLRAAHSVDAEYELACILAQEISYGIDREIISDLRALATTTASVEINHDEDYYTTATTLACEINKTATLIATKTRRGCGNWAIMSTSTLAVLQLAKGQTFQPANRDVPEYNKVQYGKVLQYAGVLNGCIKVYVDRYAQDDDILIGYKGQNDVDCGYVYSPYMPAITNGPAVDPRTYQSIVSFTTRYGKMVNPSGEHVLEGGSRRSDYFNRIEVTINMGEEFKKDSKHSFETFASYMAGNRKQP